MLEMFTKKATGQTVTVIDRPEHTLEGIEAWCLRTKEVAEGRALGSTDQVILELINGLGIVAAEVSALKWRVEG